MSQSESHDPKKEPTDRGDTSGASQPDEPRGGRPRLTRRQVLALSAGGVVAAGALGREWWPTGTSSGTGQGRPAAPTQPSRTSERHGGEGRWSDPATWGGKVPGPGDVAVVQRAVLLDVDAQVAGVRIDEGAELVFDPAHSRTLASTGNVLVAGALRARPKHADHVHRLVFRGIDEARVVGGHSMEPLDTDVGLWATGRGVLDLQGTPKQAWTRLARGADADDDRIEVDDATGWQVGDEIVVAASVPVSVDGFAEAHDLRTITRVSGTTVALDNGLRHDHPELTGPAGASRHAEVLNLSRNVRVEGTPDGRAHVMVLHTEVPQTLSHVGLRHLGPQTDEAGIEGRYALHMHMGYDGTRGSQIDGLVARECGNHAYVAHLSNGVTFRNCIAHDVQEDAYWWDLAAEGEDASSVPSNDVVYERCVAHLVRPTAASRYGLAGFTLGAGRGNVARDCVAVGVQGGDDGNAGFNWPEHSHDDNTWTFTGCIAHNNDSSGIYFWQNGVPRTIIDGFTAHSCRWGIVAGAYANLASYRDTTIIGCSDGGLIVEAVPEDPMDVPGETITFEGLHVDQRGLTDHAVELSSPHVGSNRRISITNGAFAGGRVAQVGVTEGSEYPRVYEIVDCTFDGNAFWLADDLPDDLDLTVRDAANGEIRLRPADQRGKLREPWNARVSTT